MPGPTTAARLSEEHAQLLNGNADLLDAKVRSLSVGWRELGGAGSPCVC